MSTVLRDLRHTFEPAERVRLAEEIARELIVRREACRLFAAAQKSHREALEKIDSRLLSLTRQLCEGWEYRDVPCKILLNDPSAGLQTVVRLDTGEIVEVQPMTAEVKLANRDTLFAVESEKPGTLQ